MKTYSPKKTDIKRSWHLLDAEGKVLGRLATQIAGLLMGKGKPYYAPHLDCGDYVVVANAHKVVVTGKKEKQKIYYHHSGYPGGLKETPLNRMREKHPERIIKHAVRGMLPKNKLQAPRLLRLKALAGEKNPYKDKQFVNL